MSNRSQVVDVNGSLSSEKVVGMGVPQGSTLGPLFFLLYINDLNKCFSVLKTINFADDTTLYVDFTPNNNIGSIISRDLKTLEEWLDVNRLSLNVPKSNYMVSSNKSNVCQYDIPIRGRLLNRVSKQKFLGVIIDQNLNFKSHIDKICSKVSSSVGVMRRIRGTVPQPVLKSIFYTLVHSSYSYALAAWGSAYPSALNRLRNLLREDSDFYL